MLLRPRFSAAGERTSSSACRIARGRSGRADDDRGPRGRRVIDHYTPARVTRGRLACVPRPPRPGREPGLLLLTRRMVARGEGGLHSGRVVSGPVYPTCPTVLRTCVRLGYRREDLGTARPGLLSADRRAAGAV